jgi:hypothetical protein
MLLQILAAWPAPASPQCTTRLPIRLRIGSARANASAEPPAMKVSVAALAPLTPPETGASSESWPRSPASAWALRALSTSMVELSMTSAPACTAGTMSLQTDSTCLPAGSMVTTTSASATASRAEPATLTPSALACSQEAGTRSKPTTRCCALTRFAAIGPPILPRPMNAMLVMNVSPVRVVPPAA